MKRFIGWQSLLSLILIAFSALFYCLHYFIFKDLHHIFIYMIEDIAFVFLEVLMVTIVIHKLLHYHEKKIMLNKSNMVIGVFFSEVGMELLKLFSAFEPDATKATHRLLIANNCSNKIFLKIKKSVASHVYDIDVRREDLMEIKTFLKEKRNFLLNLLENPNLLEHESFTDLLWAVFHLTEELHFRKSLKGLSPNDYQHLSLDLKRAYKRLILEWLEYMNHLKNNYSYLFSLAVRTNPFDSNASVEIK